MITAIQAAALPSTPEGKERFQQWVNRELESIDGRIRSASVHGATELSVNIEANQWDSRAKDLIKDQLREAGYRLTEHSLGILRISW